MLKWGLRRLKVIYQGKELERKINGLIKRLYHKERYHKIEGFFLQLVCTGGGGGERMI